VRQGRFFEHHALPAHLAEGAETAADLVAGEALRVGRLHHLRLAAKGDRPPPA
jgi:hypothetical protein